MPDCGRGGVRAYVCVGRGGGQGEPGGGCPGVQIMQAPTSVNVRSDEEPCQVCIDHDMHLRTITLRRAWLFVVHDSPCYGSTCQYMFLRRVEGEV